VLSVCLAIAARLSHDNGVILVYYVKPNSEETASHAYYTLIEFD